MAPSGTALSASDCFALTKRGGKWGLGRKLKMPWLVFCILVLNKRCSRRELVLGWSFIPPARAYAKQINLPAPIYFCRVQVLELENSGEMPHCERSAGLRWVMLLPVGTCWHRAVLECGWTLEHLQRGGALNL